MSWRTTSIAVVPTRRLRGLLLASVFTLPATALAQVQVNQVFNEQGPAPATGPFCVSGSGDLPAPPGGALCAVGTGQNPTLYGTNIGAVQSVVADPVDPKTLYVGALNGGVWVTHDGGTSWKNLTDNQPTVSSISISSLVLDPTNNKNLLAGTGLVSNGSLSYVAEFVGSGGPRDGLLYSKDGGQTWTVVGKGTITNSVVAAAAVGQNLLAGTWEVSNFATQSDKFQGGLWLSTNSGQNWTSVAPNGVSGPVSSIAVNPTQTNVIYAAFTASSAADFRKTAIYVSTDAGVTWSSTPIFGELQSNGTINNGNQTSIKLAAGPNNTLAVGVVNVATGNVVGLFYSQNGGTSWTALPSPWAAAINPEGAAPRLFAITVDPKDARYIYVSGDATQNGMTYTAPVFRIDTTSLTFSDITSAGTLNGSAVHADSRSLALLANGNLVITGDGGVFVRTEPRSGNGIWKGMNGFSAFETYGIAYDGLGKRLITAAQDSGVVLQTQRNTKNWTVATGADGINALVNDVTLAGSGYSVFYLSNQSIGQPARLILDQQGNFISPNTAGGYYGANVTFSQNISGLYFNSPWVRNRSNATLMALAGDKVYVTQDTLTGANGINATNVNLTLTDIGAAYNATSCPNPPQNCPVVTAIAYGIPGNTKALVAGTTYPEFYLSENAEPGAPPSLQKLAANGYTGGAPTSIVFDPRSIDRFYAADTEKLFGTSDKGSNFSHLTSFLPAGIVRPTSIEFISTNGVNALLVGGLNNVPNAQSPIAVADSDASGVLSNWRMFGQGLPLAQVGQLSYHSAVDVLAVGTWGRGVYTLYDVTSYFPQATVLQFGLADNDSKPDASYLTNGSTGTRPLIKYGSGTLTIDGTATYTGTTSVLGGTLAVNGSIASSPFTTVGLGATLAGTGTVGTTQILSGGMLAPGNGVGGLNFSGDLLFSPGSFYFVDVLGSASDHSNVTGSATLSGTVLASYLGGNLANKYTIVSATGGVNGTFNNVGQSGWPAFITASLGYTPTSAVLNLTSGLSQSAGLTRNQSAVAVALDTSFNLGRGTLPALLGVPLSQVPQAMSALSGEGVTGAQEAAFGAANIFTSLLMDQGAFWRSGNPVDPYGVSFAPGDGAALAYAPLGKKDKPIYKTGMPTFPLATNQPRWRAWFTGYDATWRLSGQADIGSANLGHNTAGAAGGFDYQLNPNLLLGFAFGGASSSFAVADRATSGQQEAGQLGVYGVQKWGQLYAAGALSLGVYDTSTTRTIVGVGPTQQATGRFSSAALTGRLEVGWRLPWMNALSVTPFAAVQVAQLWQSSFTETNVAPAGFGPLGLSYDARRTSSLPIYLGAQLDTRYQLSNGMLLLPYARVSWVHEFNRARDLAAAFIVLPDAAFSVDGARVAANAARVNLGSSIAIKRNVSLFANFDGEFASSSQSYAGKGGLRAAW